MGQRGSQKENTGVTNNSVATQCSEFNFEDVCKPGNTLLWDLVQEDKSVSVLQQKMLPIRPNNNFLHWVFSCTDNDCQTPSGSYGDFQLFLVEEEYTGMNIRIFAYIGRTTDTAGQLEDLPV